MIGICSFQQVECVKITVNRLLPYIILNFCPYLGIFLKSVFSLFEVIVGKPKRVYWEIEMGLCIWKDL